MRLELSKWVGRAGSKHEIIDLTRRAVLGSRYRPSGAARHDTHIIVHGPALAEHDPTGTTEVVEARPDTEEEVAAAGHGGDGGGRALRRQVWGGTEEWRKKWATQLRSCLEPLNARFLHVYPDLTRLDRLTCRVCRHPSLRVG